MGTPTYITYQYKVFEKIPVSIWESAGECSRILAQKIADKILRAQELGERVVLGLATGSSPIAIYRRLVKMHQEEGLSFHNVVSFNLDEYYPMEPEAQQSYVRFMHENLFDHIDIPSDQIFIPDGTLKLEDVSAYCLEYEKKIQEYGGIDIQLLGIGRTGHVGFNEPGSRMDSITRLVRLDNLTIRDARKDFLETDKVPFRAITMGMRTIMSSKTIYLIAWGSHKSHIIRQAVEGEITASVPCSYLQNHPDVHCFVDIPASENLTRVRTPWLAGMCEWDDDLMCRAVVWLSQKINRPILKLTDEDYNEHGIGELILKYESTYDINIKVFNRLQHTITGWPGGKPNADDSTRPERAVPAHKRIIIFSPHPDDDVISMGGTFIRLVDQGHEVHVAYQTSGNIAVHDHDAIRYIEFYKEFTEVMQLQENRSGEIEKKVLDFIHSKSAGAIDMEEVKIIKGLIRKGEARAGARRCGLRDDQIHFLDMPFYETGSTRKNPLSAEDISIVAELIKEIKPHQVFAAGDLADPHGTHRVCLDAIVQAVKSLQGESWIKECWLWLYRGAWHEWRIDEIQMAVPISPSELVRKRKAIFMHQSQKDRPPFPGEDDREFWERAEDRNRATAKYYRQLGLAEYEAMEAFRRWTF